MIVISMATAYDARPIQTMHKKNVSIVNFGCFLQSGTVSHRASVIGHFKKNAQQFVSCGILYGVSA